jgi:hypothetical protein
MKDLIFEAEFIGRSHRKSDSYLTQIFYDKSTKTLIEENVFNGRSTSNQEYDFIKEKDIAKKIIDIILMTSREFILSKIIKDEYKIKNRIPEKVFTEKRLKENNNLVGFDVEGNEWIKVYIGEDAYWISNDMYDDRTHYQ